MPIYPFEIVYVNLMDFSIRLIDLFLLFYYLTKWLSKIIVD